MFHFQILGWIYGHIDGMSHDDEEHLCGKQKSNSFSIKVDDSTNFTHNCSVVAFEKFLNDDEIQENFSVTKRCLEHGKGRAIFNIVYSYQETTSVSGKLCRCLY
jgi:hypothetical protein